jgi:hypothetical protein
MLQSRRFIDDISSHSHKSELQKSGLQNPKYLRPQSHHLLPQPHTSTTTTSGWNKIMADMAEEDPALAGKHHSF